jgi:hypothetical protein
VFRLITHSNQVSVQLSVDLHMASACELIPEHEPPLHLYEQMACAFTYEALQRSSSVAEPGRTLTLIRSLWLCAQGGICCAHWRGRCLAQHAHTGTSTRKESPLTIQVRRS